MRRDARRSERRGLARDGRITLRRALGIATALVAGWLPTPTATPTPTPAPSPTPTAAPTSVPTSYAESIDPEQTQASIPPTNANVAVVSRPTGSGSPISQWALLAIVVFAVTAGTGFFLFFKIR